MHCFSEECRRPSDGESASERSYQLPYETDKTRGTF